ncbi:MAG: NAD(P)/FAD-dependent oxidoreductase [Candidatus Micrarchaeota archaeon]|nr:NAD(P)/FAD-dependent oxidoreductase [Candidatus Micrarchaeota archaeon]
MTEIFDTIIIGGGVTGFSAAMYAGRLKLNTLVISAIRGGTIILTNDIANWPGIKQTDGITLAKQIEEHALEYPEVKVKDAKVVKVVKTKEIYEVQIEDGEKFQSKTIIFATGTEWKKLNVPGEKEYTGNGVHYCALCDGYAYKGKTIAVIGGADSAAKEAVLLTQWASKVYIIYRGTKIRPEPVNMTRVENKIKEGKMEIVHNTNVVEIKGDGKRVTHAMLDKPYKGSKEFKIDGLFVEIGHIPQSQLAISLGVNVNKKGDIIIDRGATTNVPGIYAAGDVVDTKFKQAITGSAEGVLAAYSVYEYVRNEKL